MNSRTDVLCRLLKPVDECIQLLNQYDVECSPDSVRMVKDRVDWFLQQLEQTQLSLLHEVVYFLDLASFHLLMEEGESFPIYLAEINQRYRHLLDELQRENRQERTLTMV